MAIGTRQFSGIRARAQTAARTLAVMQRRFGAIRGSNLAAAISMRAFLALFPIVILAVAAVSLAGGKPDSVAHDITKALGLNQRYGDVLRDSIATARKGRGATGVIGIIGLVWTGTGLSAAVNAAWDEAWSIPGGALRGRAAGVVWLIGGLVFVAAMVALNVGLRADVLIELGVIGGILGGSLFFLWTAYTLPARRLPWREMVRPALVGGIALEILRVLGAIVVPLLVRRSSNAYGTIGVVFAILVWLLVVGHLIVYIAIFERARAKAP